MSFNNSKNDLHLARKMIIEKLIHCHYNGEAIVALQFQPHPEKWSMERLATIAGSQIRIWAIILDVPEIVPDRANEDNSYHKDIHTSAGSESVKGEKSMTVDRKDSWNSGASHISSICLFTSNRHSPFEIGVLKWSHDGKYLATADNCGCLHVHELDTEKKLSHSFEQSSEKEDLESWKVVSTLRCPEGMGQFFDVAWSSDSQSIVGGGIKGQLAIFDVTSKEMTGRLESPLEDLGFIKGVAWDSNSGYIAAQSSNRYSMIWQCTPNNEYPSSWIKWSLHPILTDTELFAEGPGDIPYARSITFDATGRYVAFPFGERLGSCFGVCYDLSEVKRAADASEKPPFRFRGHQSRVNVVSFNNYILKGPNTTTGRNYMLYAQGSEDGCISIWRVGALHTKGRYKLDFYSECKCVCVISKLLDEQSCISGLSWGNMGKYIAVGSTSGGVHLIVMDEAELGLQYKVVYGLFNPKVIVSAPTIPKNMKELNRREQLMGVTTFQRCGGPNELESGKRSRIDPPVIATQQNIVSKNDSAPVLKVGNASTEATQKLALSSEAIKKFKLHSQSSEHLLNDGENSSRKQQADNPVRINLFYCFVPSMKRGVGPPPLGTDIYGGALHKLVGRVWMVKMQLLYMIGMMFCWIYWKLLSWNRYVHQCNASGSSSEQSANAEWRRGGNQVTGSGGDRRVLQNGQPQQNGMSGDGSDDENWDEWNPFRNTRRDILTYVTSEEEMSDDENECSNIEGSCDGETMILSLGSSCTDDNSALSAVTSTVKAPILVGINNSDTAMDTVSPKNDKNSKHTAVVPPPVVSTNARNASAAASSVYSETNMTASSSTNKNSTASQISTAFEVVANSVTPIGTATSTGAVEAVGSSPKTNLTYRPSVVSASAAADDKKDTKRLTSKTALVVDPNSVAKPSKKKKTMKSPEAYAVQCSPAVSIESPKSKGTGGTPSAPSKHTAQLLSNTKAARAAARKQNNKNTSTAIVSKKPPDTTVIDQLPNTSDKTLKAVNSPVISKGKQTDVLLNDAMRMNKDVAITQLSEAESTPLLKKDCITQITASDSTLDISDEGRDVFDGSKATTLCNNVRTMYEERLDCSKYQDKATGSTQNDGHIAVVKAAALQKMIMKTFCWEKTYRTVVASNNNEPSHSTYLPGAFLQCWRISEASTSTSSTTSPTQPVRKEEVVWSYPIRSGTVTHVAPCTDSPILYVLSQTKASPNNGSAEALKDQMVPPVYLHILSSISGTALMSNLVVPCAAVAHLTAYNENRFSILTIYGKLHIYQFSVLDNTLRQLLSLPLFPLCYNTSSIIDNSESSLNVDAIASVEIFQYPSRAAAYEACDGFLDKHFITAHLQSRRIFMYSKAFKDCWFRMDDLNFTASEFYDVRAVKYEEAATLLRCIQRNCNINLTNEIVIKGFCEMFDVSFTKLKEIRQLAYGGKSSVKSCNIKNRVEEGHTVHSKEVDSTSVSSIASDTVAHCEHQVLCAALIYSTTDFESWLKLYFHKLRECAMIEKLYFVEHGLRAVYEQEILNMQQRIERESAHVGASPTRLAESCRLKSRLPRPTWCNVVYFHNMNLDVEALVQRELLLPIRENCEESFGSDASIFNIKYLECIHSRSGTSAFDEWATRLKNELVAFSMKADKAWRELKRLHSATITALASAARKDNYAVKYASVGTSGTSSSDVVMDCINDIF